MKKLLALILALLAIVATFASCGDESSSSSADSSSSETSSSEESSSSESKAPTESSNKKDENKYPEVSKIEYDVNINQTVNTNVFNTWTDFGNAGEAIDYSVATDVDVSKGITNITAPGIYRLYGTTTKGHVKVDIDRLDETAPLEKVILIFDNINITSYSDAASIPPIYSKGCDLTIIIPKGTNNTITDTKTNSQKGAIYVKTGNLTIEGEGTLKVTAVHKNAIFNTKSITVNGGVFDLSAEYHGIYGESGLVINTGDFKILSGKSAIKSGEYEVENLPEQNVLGGITINNGKFSIDSQGNAIDCYGSITINGGGYNIESAKDGINATDKIVFGGTEANTVMIIEAKEDGIKVKSDATIDPNAEIVPNIKITGKTNIKIIADNDAIQATDIEIDIDGVMYLKTNAKFVEDMENGEYILDNKEYYKVDRTLYDGKTFFKIDGSNKGITAKNSITIKNGQIAIDADEEAIETSDGSQEDASTINKIVISGGVLNLDSRESAVKADNAITVSGTAKVNVIKSDKGLNADAVTIDNGTVILVSIKDSIDADNTIVNNGTVYLFDKVDYPSDGTFVVNAGTVICISTTKNPKAPSTAASKIIAKSIEAPAQYKFGSYINIKGGSLDIVLKLPKNYSEKLSVVVTSADVTAGNYSISAGTYVNGSVANLVCTGGTFTASSTETASVQ